MWLVAAWFIVFAVPGASAASVQGGGTAQLDPTTQSLLGELHNRLGEDIAVTRKGCALGEAPEQVAAKRASYGPGQAFPDASAMCLSSMAALGRQHHLLGFYEALVASAGGDPALSRTLPRAIGAAVLGGAAKVSLGGGKVAGVTPALAFDAGFTVAYDAGRPPQAAANPVQLKAVAEACLSQRQDAGTCFSVGYVYGGRAGAGQGALP